MMQGDPWSQLGIDPTDDARAIRVAYTAKLKEIDPEADPQAFIALRAAFEAIRSNGLGAVEPAIVELQPERERQGYRADEAPPAVTWPEPEQPHDRPDPDAPAKALYALLWSGIAAHEGKPWREAQATAAQIADMRDLWHALITDPRMEQVTHYADVERWLSELIAGTAPLSDPLVARATLSFGWKRSPAEVDRTPAIAWIVWRHRLLDYVAALETRDHVLHRAWRELVTPVAEGGTRGAADVRHIHELLNIAEFNYPGLDTFFVPERVALWTARTVERRKPKAVKPRGTEADRQARQWFAAGVISIGFIFFLGLAIAIAGTS